jgi:hypothetical protein
MPYMTTFKSLLTKKSFPFREPSEQAQFIFKIKRAFTVSRKVMKNQQFTFTGINQTNQNL